ncbi:MAG: hypothetical protein HY819_22390 [Acidobacteria bacterium]|nr:hypothetical protein [Acidobacteriota bacterium]
MSDSKQAAREALSRYSMEYRVCHLMLFFAASDGQLSEQEIQTTCVYIKAVLEALKSNTDLKELVLGCLEDMKNNGNVEVLKETIAIFAQDVVPKDALEKIVQGIQDVCKVDGLSPAEAELLECLKKDWNLS